MASGAVLEVLDISPSWAVIVGRLELDGLVYAAAVNGPHAYLVGSAGLHVVDLTDPDSPTLAGQLDATGFDDLAVGGGTAYLAGSGGLKIVDVSNPSDPVEIGSLNESVSGVAVRNGYAYLADSSVVRVIDLSDPSAPVEVGTVPGGGEAIATAGAHAYVIDGWDGLSVLDLGTPAAPVEIGSVATFAWPCDASAPARIAVGNGHAYVTSGACMETVDVGNPASPAVVDSYFEVYGQTLNIAVDGDRLYLSAGSEGVTAFDIASPSSPSEIWSRPSAKRGVAIDIAVAGDHAFVADYYVGIHSFDVTDPTQPVRLDTLRLFTTPSAIDVEGDHAFVTDQGYPGSLVVIDVSNPSNLVYLGSVGTPGAAVDVDVVGGYAYVADRHAGIRVIDVGNPAHPVEVGSFTAGTSSYRPTAVEVHGQLAFVASGLHDLHILDVGTPSAPFEVGVFDSLSSGSDDVEIDGPLAYVTSYSRDVVYIVDVSNPALPVQAGLVATVGHPEHIAVDWPWAYVTATYLGTRILDIRTPADAADVGGFRDLGHWFATGVAVAGGRAYVSTATTGFVVLDPCVPVFTDGFESGDTSAWSATAP